MAVVKYIQRSTRSIRLSAINIVNFTPDKNAKPIQGLPYEAARALAKEYY